MSPQRREIRSGYIEWAKLRSKSRYNLATSDVVHFTLADLHPSIADLELSGADGYGYQPLLQKLSAKSGVPVECIVQAQGTSMANHLAMAALVEPGDEVSDRRAYVRGDSFHGGISGRENPALSPQIRIGISTGPARSGAQYFRAHAADRHHQSAQSQRRAHADAKLRMVGEIARSMGAHVLVDEVYLEACFDSPWQTAFLLGPNFVTTSSLTKAYGLTGLRCGWIFAAKRWRSGCGGLNDLFGVMAPHPIELLSVLALEHLPEIAARAKQLLDNESRAAERILQVTQGPAGDLAGSWNDRVPATHQRPRGRFLPVAAREIRNQRGAGPVFSKRPNIFASGSAGIRKMCAKAWRAWARRWMSWPRRANLRSLISAIRAAFAFDCAFLARKNDVHQRLRRGGQRTILPVHQIEMPLDAHLRDSQFAQISARQFSFDAHARHDGDAFFHFHESLDAFDGGELHFHAQRNFVFREHLDHAMAIRRFHDVRDESFFAQRGDVHFACASPGDARARPPAPASRDRIPRR